MDELDREIKRVHSLHAIKTCMLRLKWLRDATRFELAMRRHDRALKAGYDPEQPRDEYGKWTNDGIDGGDQSSENHLDQSLTTATDQAERSDLKGLKDIANSAAVRPQIDQAWKSSTAREGPPKNMAFGLSETT